MATDSSIPDSSTPAEPKPGDLTGEITLDRLNPPHGKITGSVVLPPIGGGGFAGFEVLPLAYRQLEKNEFAVVTYNKVVGGVADVQKWPLDSQTVHFGPGNQIPVGYPPALNASIHQDAKGYIIRLK